MPRSVLVTGGAGFIGSHLADALLARGDRVRVLDALCEQVHGPDPDWPEHLHRAAERISADVRDQHAVRDALDGIDAVVHLAARVGVGQSMYQVHDYVTANADGTAVLLDALAERPVSRLVVASSMSIYGEGTYRARDGSLRQRVTRQPAALREQLWEPVDVDGGALSPWSTAESKPPVLASVYALTKFDQEQMCLMIGAAYGIPTVALRLFNVYGPRQALSNPYTGVLAIFASRLANGRPPILFEDGAQRRDFVSVHDVVQAFLCAIDADAANLVVNVGSGRSITIRELAARLRDTMGCGHIEPIVSGRYRTGDIRHCFADISRARELLGYRPRVELDDGLEELVGWIDGQTSVDRVEEAHAELAARGLV